MKNIIQSLLDSDTILYLGRDDVLANGVQDFSALMSVIEKAYLAHFESDVLMPKLDYLKYPGRSTYDRIIVLLGYLGGEFCVSGMKEICSSTSNFERGFPRASGVIVLNDPYTQRPIAILEASAINAARTAAVTAVAVHRLKPEKVEKVAFIGCGAQARTHCQMWSQLFRDSCSMLHVFDIAGGKAESFAEWAKEQCQMEVTVCSSAQAAISGADVVVTLTTEEVPYIESGWIKESSLYAAVSLLDPKLEVLADSDFLVVDDVELCKHEGRPLQKLDEAGLLEPSRLVTIGALIGRQVQVRKGRERIFFNPMGTIITDLAVASSVVQKAIASNRGVRLPV